MAFSATGNVGDIDIGTFLKIYSTNGVYNNLSEASEMWKFFLKLKAGPSSGRELRYLLRTSYGPAAVQSLPAGSSGDYPAGQRSNLAEGTAQYKEYALTVNVPRNLLDKTGSDLLQYADPLTEEMDAKAIAAARIMSGQMYRDGSGAIGVISATAPTVSTANDTMSIALSTSSTDGGRSHVGWFELDDKVKFADTDGVAQSTTNNTGTTVDYWLVTDIDEDADTVTMQPYDSSDTLIDITDATIGATDPNSGDYCYRYGTTPNDLNPESGVSDWNAISEEMCGLESLTQDDGRTVNGIALSGAVKGTRTDLGTSQVDSSHFQAILSKTKRKVGKGRYNYRNAFMYDTVFDAMIEQSEVDRRIQTIDDATRGFKKLGYQHGNDFVEFTSDEFCSKQRIWMPPESKEVLEFHGRDFEVVEVNPGQKFHLKTSSTGAGHSRQNQAYMEGSAVIVCKHPAAVACLTNFSASS